LPASLGSIPNNAFYGCTSLTSVTIPDGPASIGNSAFRSCDKITEFEVPATVNTIGTDVFVGCSQLRSIDFSRSGVTSLTVSSLSTKSPLSDCPSLEYVYLPKGLATYGGGALPKNSGLVMEIAEDAPNFAVVSDGKILKRKSDNSLVDCLLTGNVVIPGGITSIGASAFSKHLGLTRVEIPGEVTSIGNNAFSECTNLGEVVFSSPGLISIGDSAFSRCTNLEEVVFPSTGLTTIGAYAFSRCTNLEEVVFPSTGLTSIGIYAFEYCSSLEAITLPGSLAGSSAISNSAFSSSGVKNVTIEEGVTRISDQVFQYCVIDRVDLPSTITSIGTYAFLTTSGTSPAITTLIVRASVPPGIGGTTANNSAWPSATTARAVGTIYVPDANLAAYETAGTYPWSWKAYNDAGKLKALSTLVP
jgi:hypothetical protein